MAHARSRIAAALTLAALLSLSLASAPADASRAPWDMGYRRAGWPI